MDKNHLADRGALRSRGRGGGTIVPNWRWEDDQLDPYDLRIAGWIRSHTDSYRADHVTRNEIARRTHVSGGRVSASIVKLTALGIIDVDATIARGGKRWVITFDLDVWERPPEVVTTRPVTDRLPVAYRPVTGHHATTSGDPYVPLLEEQEELLPITPTDTVSTEHSDPVGLGSEESEEDRFARFWTAYPRKVGKPAARRAFITALKRYDVDVVRQGFKRWRDHWRCEGTQAKHIPHPATWLNDERFNDMPPPPDERLHGGGVYKDPMDWADALCTDSRGPFDWAD